MDNGSRRARVAGVVAGVALVAGIVVASAPADDPVEGVRVPSLADHQALVDRVDALEDRVAELEPTEEPTPTPTETPTPTPTETPAGEWPTPETTGPRTSTLTPSGSVTTTADGQVIEGLEITGRLTIRHSNVTVRDVKINGTGTYMLYVDDLNGVNPSNVLVEYVEIDGSGAAESDIPIYMPGSDGTVIDHAYVHDVGRSSRLVNNGTIQNSYIFSSRTGSSGSHRGAVGLNGGHDNALIGNVLKCQGTGCSAAIPNYGDFAPVVNFHIEGNLLATTGSYCAYGGSLASKPYPEASNVDFIGNHFSTEYHPTCGQFGPISGYAAGVRGNDWSGNVWHETGEPLDLN